MYANGRLWMAEKRFDGVTAWAKGKEGLFGGSKKEKILL